MSAQNYGPILTKFNQIEIQENLWLWPGRIPLGAITTLIGFGGEGKSFLACSIACAVSRGNPFPDGSPAPVGDVVVMAGEDLRSKLRLRYEANGANLERVTLLEGQRIYTKNGPADINLTLRDIDQIREAVDRTSNVKLLIVDPVGDFIPGINSDKDNEVRALLNPLAQLAKERELAVLMICHRKKSAGERADHAALGSVAFTSKARAVHHVILDPHDTAKPNERRRLFLPGKLNDQQQSQGLAFKIIAPSSPGSTGPASAGIIEWEKDPLTHTADAIMQYAVAKARANRTLNPDAITDAQNWLAKALTKGARSAKEMASEARADGIAAYPLRRARENLGVVHTKIGSRGIYLWELPKSQTNQLPQTAIFADAPTTSSHGEPNLGLRARLRPTESAQARNPTTRTTTPPSHPTAYGEIPPPSERQPEPVTKQSRKIRL